MNCFNDLIDLLLDRFDFVLASIGSELLFFDDKLKMEREPEKIQKEKPVGYTEEGDDDDDFPYNSCM